MNALITHGDHFPSVKDFALFFYLVLVALQIWFYTTMYFNRFGKRSLLDYLSLILNMYFLFFMGTSMEHVILEHYTRYHIALALILFNLSHLNFRRSKECKDCLDVTVLQANALDFFLQGILVVITIPIHYFWGLILSPLAMMFGYCSRIFEHRFFSGKSVDFSHLSERALLLVILTFGESIIAISEYFHYGGKFFFNITSFLITVGLFMHYAFFMTIFFFIKRRVAGSSIS